MSLWLLVNIIHLPHYYYYLDHNVKYWFTSNLCNFLIKFIKFILPGSHYQSHVQASISQALTSMTCLLTLDGSQVSYMHLGSNVHCHIV